MNDTIKLADEIEKAALQALLANYWLNYGKDDHNLIFANSLLDYLDAEGFCIKLKEESKG